MNSKNKIQHSYLNIQKLEKELHTERDNYMKMINTDSADTQKQKQTIYDKKSCNDCLKRIETTGINEFCTHCTTQHYDRSCLPTVIQDDVPPTNCIPKSVPIEKAFWYCKSRSTPTSSCQMITNESNFRQNYMNQVCGDDYYCTYDSGDSCNYQLCNISGDNKFFDPQSNCFCAVPKNEKLPKNFGRQCSTPDCSDYDTLINEPLKLNDENSNLKYLRTGFTASMDIL